MRHALRRNCVMYCNPLLDLYLIATPCKSGEIAGKVFIAIGINRAYQLLADIIARKQHGIDQWTEMNKDNPKPCKECPSKFTACHEFLGCEFPKQDDPFSNSVV